MGAIADAVAMPWGGERNLALRAALGLVEGEVGMVNLGDVVMLVVTGHGRANKLAKALGRDLPSWTVRLNTRPHDRRYVVTAYTNEAALAAQGADLDQVRRLLLRGTTRPAEPNRV